MLPYQQVVMTLDNHHNLPFKAKYLDTPSQCFHVFIGKKYLQRMDEVVLKIEKVGRLLGGKPIALFVLGPLKKFDLENTANLVRNRSTKQISKNVIKLVS